MSKKIYFDLDGTLYNLYQLPGWLKKVESETPGVFLEGEFLVDKNLFNDSIKELIMQGYNFGVITWLPYGISPEYEEICRQEKLEWIQNNLPFVTEINIVPYGTSKQKAIQKKAQLMYLIDDNVDVCKKWQSEKQRVAVCVDEEFTALDALNQIIEES